MRKALLKKIIVPFYAKERASEKDSNNRGRISSILRYNFASQYITNNFSVLDIACGEGIGTIVLAQKAMTVGGIDCCFNAVKIAKSKYSLENVHFEVMDATSIGYKKNIFDVVCAFEIIKHLRHPDLMLKEIKRVLKHNGILILSTPNKISTEKNIIQNPYHIKEYYLEELKTVLGCYFNITQTVGIVFKKKTLEDLTLFKYYLKLKKKIGILKWEINPKIKKNMFGEAKITDFNISHKNLNDCLYFIIVCRKQPII